MLQTLTPTGVIGQIGRVALKLSSATTLLLIMCRLTQRCTVCTHVVSTLDPTATKSLSDPSTPRTACRRRDIHIDIQRASTHCRCASPLRRSTNAYAIYHRHHICPSTPPPSECHRPCRCHRHRRVSGASCAYVMISASVAFVAQAARFARAVDTKGKAIG